MSTPKRAALATGIHRISAMAHWNAVTGAIAWLLRTPPFGR